jgi:hypothetical protein
MGLVVVFVRTSLILAVPEEAPSAIPATNALVQENVEPAVALVGV